MLDGRDLLGLTLLMAGARKLSPRNDLAKVVRGYDVLPTTLVAPISAVVPLVELALGSLLFASVLPVAVAALTACLLLAFAVAMAVNLASGRRPVCGCFGAAGSRIGWWTLVRTLLLAAVSAILAIIDPPLADLQVGQAVAACAAAALALATIGTAAEARRLRRLISVVSYVAGARP